MNKQTKDLNQSNNTLDEQISPENHEAFTDIICYLRGADISEYHQEVIRLDLLEMVLSAQERGENIQAVVGQDYKYFCDDIIASLPPKTKKEKVFAFFDIFCWCLSILSAINIVIANETINLIRNSLTGQPLNFQIAISVGSVISALLILVIAVLVVEVILKNAFSIGKKEKMHKAKAFLIGAGITAVFLLIAWLGRATLFTVNIFVACVFTVTLYFAHRVLAKI